MKTIHTIQTLIAMAVICSAALVHAQSSKTNLSDDASFSVSHGELVYSRGGTTVLRYVLKDADPTSTATINRVPLREGSEIVHVITQSLDLQRLEFIFIATRGHSALRPVWSGVTALKGDIGEQIGTRAELRDLNSDKIPEIAIGTVSASVSLCGTTDMPLLYRSIYDETSGLLVRRTVGRGFEKMDGEITGVAMVPTAPNRLARPPLNPLIPESVSSSNGDQGNPMLQTLPAGLLDGNNETGWIPGHGSGNGEFVTFSNRAAPWEIAELRIFSSVPSTGSKTFRAPRSILLATENAVFRLIFPSGDTGRAVSFSLPKPVKSRCLSLVVEEPVEKVTDRSTPPAISDVVLITALGEDRAIDALVGALDSVDHGETAADLLRDFGALVVEPIQKKLPSFSRSGKRRAVRLLAEKAPLQSTALLAAFAVEDDEAVATPALQGIRRAGDIGAKALGSQLNAKDSHTFRNTVNALSRLDTTAAFAQLLEAAGRGPDDRRKQIRSAVQTVLKRNPAHAPEMIRALETIALTPPDRRSWDLLYAAVSIPDTTPAAIAIAEKLYSPDADFETRFRAVRVAALSQGDGHALLLRGIADGDIGVQEMSILGLGAHLKRPANTDAFNAVARHLKSEAPQVRIAALRVLSLSQSLYSAEDTVKSIAAADPWPGARVSALILTPKFIRGGEETIRTALKDKSGNVRAAALKISPQISGATVNAAILELIRDSEQSLAIRSLAADAAGQRCQNSDDAVEALFDLLRLGAEPLAAAEEQEAGSVAANALGLLGTPAAKEALKKARTRSNPVTDRAIDAALARKEPACTPK